MDLEIQTQQIDLDPDWRDLIERLAARLEARYPEMLRLHVTVRHGPHHRRGVEEVALVANLGGVTLRADKQEEHARTALHAAFDALGTELEHHHRERRRVTKSPGGARAPVVLESHPLPPALPDDEVVRTVASIARTHASDSSEALPREVTAGCEARRSP